MEKAARQDNITGDIILAYASSGILRERGSKLAINENTYIEQSVKPFVIGSTLTFLEPVKNPAPSKNGKMQMELVKPPVNGLSAY